MNEATHRLNIKRIIYMWKRYSGIRILTNKSFNFSDIEILEERIDTYLRNPERFNFSEGENK